jgi:hypothetical protein
MRAYYGEGSTDLKRAAASIYLLTTDLVDVWNAQMLQASAEMVSRPRVARGELLDSLLRVSATHALQSPSEWPTVVYTNPFAHRPLVEFALSLPVDVLYRPGEPRALMKQAFEAFVPERVLTRFSKGYYAPLIMRRVQQTTGAWLDRIDQLEVVRRGYVDRSRLRTRLEAVRAGAFRISGVIPALTRLEQWLEGRAAVRHQCAR